MSNKRPFFHLGQLFSGFCPPSSFDHFETAKDDSDDGGIYGGRKTKDVVSVTVDDSPRKVKVIDRSSKTVIPKDTTSIKMNELWKDDLIHITKAETTDSGSIKNTLPLEASAEADPTAQSSPGRIIFQSTVMIGIFVLYSLAYFNQENIQSIYLDSVFELPTKHMKTVSEKTTKNLKDPIETSQDTTIDEKYVNLEFYDVESALDSQANTIIHGDKALSTAGDTSISSPEHGAMSEALHNIDDDTADKSNDDAESVRNDSDQEETNESDCAADIRKQVQKDTTVRFFKLETDETGPYLVSCERPFKQSTGLGSLPTFVCSEKI